MARSLPRIVAVIDNVNMSASHDSLATIAKKLKIDTKSLESNELLLFLNRAKTRMKVLGGGGAVIGYIRAPSTRAIPLDAIQYLPETFSATGRIDIDAAIRKSVTQRINAPRDSRSEYPDCDRIG